MEMKNKKSSTIVRKVLTGLFLAGFAVCVAWLTVYFVQTKQAEAEFEAMKESYVAEQPVATEQPTVTKAPEQPTTPEASTEASAEVQTTEAPVAASKYPGLDGYDVPQLDIDFEALRKDTNEHIYAWIRVPGTVIDYPIVQHPELPDYYLDYNLDGTKGYPGGIYTQLYNSKDWTDPNTVIYGHNMKNGTMFAGLHQYEDSEFFKEYPYVYIYSEDKIRVYQVFAAYEYSDVNLVTYFGLPGVMTYEEYLASIYELDGINNNFNTDIQVTTEDKIVTLLTCISTKPTMRYLVQAVLVAEGDV